MFQGGGVSKQNQLLLEFRGCTKWLLIGIRFSLF